MTSPPILLYHKITPKWDVSVTLTSPKALHSQMRSLRRAGWRGIPLKEWDGGEKDFVIAFDDGYQCVGDYAPEILAEFGFRASVFFPAGYLGRSNDWDHQVYGLKFRHLNSDGLKKLVGAGWEIGSHTVSHCSLLDLNEDRIKTELTLSKVILEEISGQQVESISFPFGRYNQNILDSAVLAGYKTGVTPRFMSGVIGNDSFKLYEADAVYIWDRFSCLIGRLERTGTAYQVGRSFRKIINQAGLGTVIYQRIFSTSIKDLPEG